MSTNDLDVYEVAKGIVRRLAGARRWSVHTVRGPQGERSKDAAALKRRDGGEILMSIDRDENRVSFRPCWPSFRDGTECEPAKISTITCKAERDVAELAHDLESRLLVRYEPAYEVARGRVRKSDAAATAAWRAAEQFARVLGGYVDRYARVRNSSPVNVRTASSVIPRLTVYPAGDAHELLASFEVDKVDVKLAQRLIALVNSNKAREASLSADSEGKGVP